jgi:hypothetical protein
MGLAATSFAPVGTARADDDRPGFPPHEPPRVVSLIKTAEAPRDLAPEGTFDYFLTIHNRTDKEASAVVSDTLPAQTQLVGSAVVTVLSPTVTNTTVTVDPALGPNGTLRWEGALSAGAKLRIAIKVKLLRCAVSDNSSFIGWNRSVSNVATLRVNNTGLSVSAYAFVPGGCKDDDRPNPRPRPEPLTGVDVAVSKYARLHPDWDRPDLGWKASWLVLYGNRGSETARDVVITDTPSSNQILSGVRSAPLLTPTQQGGAFVFTVGELASQRGGGILLRTTLPFSTPAGTQLDNSVVISASNDMTTTNNTDAVSLTVPYLPPIITSPISGITCSGTLTITGIAQTGEVVNLYDGETLIISTTANAAGRWSVPVSLEDGVHILHARLAKDDTEDDDDLQITNHSDDKRKSNKILLKVDSDLIWDPISLTFAGSDGTTKRPRHWLGWMDHHGWYVSLAPSTTYTASLRVCCADPATASVSMTVPGVGVVAMSDLDGDTIFTGSFTTGDAKSMLRGKLEISVTCDGETATSNGRIVPTYRRPGHRIIVITREGFDPPNVRVRPGEIIEFVNMDEGARSFGTSPNLMAMAEAAAGGMAIQSAEAQAAFDADAVQLEVGESYTVEAGGNTTFYDAQNSNQRAVIDAGNGVYLPLVRR